MAYISIDIDLDEFDLKDLLSECYYQLEKAQKRSDKKVIDSFNDLKELLVVDQQSKFEINNVLDQMKLDHLTKVFDKYTLEQLEKLLPMQ